MQPRYCPNCGAETAAASRFCPRCGEDLQSRQAASGVNVQAYDRVTPLPVDPFPPTTPSTYSGPTSQPGFASYGPSPTQTPFQTNQMISGPGPLPSPTPIPPSRRQRGRSVGKALLILVLILAFFSAGGYIVYALIEGNAAQPQITTRTLQTAVKYAGVNVTITKVEQSERFVDDPHSTSDGMVRIHLQAENKTSVPVNMVYSNITRLVLPGNKVVTPTYVNGNTGLQSGKAHNDYIDFAVPSSTDTSKLILRLGDQNEAQMDIPLSTQADVSKYEPHNTQIGKPLESKTTFYGLDWTLDSAMTQWSIDGKQASKGMRFVTVTLKVDSTLEQTAIPGSAFDYARLKAGSTTATPTQTTLPVSFEKESKGTTGTITFMVPQDQTSLTLTLEPDTNSGFDSAQVTFNLP